LLQEEPPETEERHYSKQEREDEGGHGSGSNGFAGRKGRYQCVAARASWLEVTERSSGTHKPEVQREVTAISNENKQLRFASQRVKTVAPLT
jgi:hypothetical protein